VTQVRSNEQIGQTAMVVAERGKEYGVKTFSFLKSVYANAAAQVETVAQEHGYKVDLGARGPARPVTRNMLHCMHSCACRECFST